MSKSGSISPSFRSPLRQLRHSGTHSRGPSIDFAPHDTDKKRLVEQFYSTESHNTKSPVTNAAIATGFRSNLSSGSFLDAKDLVQPANHEALADEKFKELVAAGQLKFVALDRELSSSQGAVESLLNVDLDRPIEDELQYLEQLVSDAALGLLRTLGHSKLEPEATATAELARLSKHLQELHSEASQAREELLLAAEKLKSQYSSELRSSVDKLEDLEMTLRKLDLRFNYAKRSTSEAKTLLANTIETKIALLEKVSQRFAEYDLQHRRRRIRQTISALSVLVLLLCIYVAAHTIL